MSFLYVGRSLTGLTDFDNAVFSTITVNGTSSFIGGNSSEKIIVKNSNGNEVFRIDTITNKTFINDVVIQNITVDDITLNSLTPNQLVATDGTKKLISTNDIIVNSVTSNDIVTNTLKSNSTTANQIVTTDSSNNFISTDNIDVNSITAFSARVTSLLPNQIVQTNGADQLITSNNLSNVSFITTTNTRTLLPTGSYDIGSISNRYSTVYANTINANTITAGSVNYTSLTTNDLTVNNTINMSGLIANSFVKLDGSKNMISDTNTYYPTISELSITGGGVIISSNTQFFRVRSATSSVDRFIVDGNPSSPEIQVRANIIPLDDNSYSIGTSSEKYTAVHAQDIITYANFYAQDGSEANPTYTFINDTDTGMYNSGGTLRLCASGKIAFRIGSTFIQAFRNISPKENNVRYLGLSNAIWNRIYLNRIVLTSDNGLQTNNLIINNNGFTYVSGDINMNGLLRMQNNITASTNNTYDIGTNSSRFNNVYFNNLFINSLKIGNQTLTPYDGDTLVGNSDVDGFYLTLRRGGSPTASSGLRFSHFGQPHLFMYYDAGSIFRFDINNDNTNSPPKPGTTGYSATRSINIDGSGNVTAEQTLRVLSSSSTTVPRLYLDTATNVGFTGSSSNMRLIAGGSTRMTLGTNISHAGNFTPSADNVQDLGGSSLRYSNLFVVNVITSGTIVPDINGLRDLGTSTRNFSILYCQKIYFNGFTNSITPGIRSPNAGTGFEFYVDNSARFWITSNGFIQIAGNTAYKSAGGLWTNPSDIRLKEDIEDFTHGLDIIEKINPKKFKFKSGDENTNCSDCKKHVGIIAQEMLEVYPKAIKLGEDGMYSYDGNDVIFMLINAIKELKQMIMDKSILME